MNAMAAAMLPIRRLGDMHTGGLRKLKLTTSQLATAASGRTLCDVSLGGPSPLQHAAAAFTDEMPKSFNPFTRWTCWPTLCACRAAAP